MPFVQHKSLRKRFWRIAVNEKDLARMASIVHNATSDFEGDLDIEVLSADGEDTFRSNDPNFFFNKNLPLEISKVRISYRHYSAPISCDLHFSTGHDGRCELSVDGEDPTVASGLFRELAREVESRTSPGVWWTKQLDNYLMIGLLISFLTATAIYCTIDFALFIADISVEGFKESSVRSMIVSIGWACVGLGFIFGGPYVERFLKSCLPVVQFRGHISDPGSASRARLIWVVSALVLPILLNVLASLISDVIKRISE